MNRAPQFNGVNLYYLLKNLSSARQPASQVLVKGEGVLWLLQMPDEADLNLWRERIKDRLH